ncbi:hypothetical protein DEU56DRAFT_813962 [Suillus clintonianus]|uniref:uncharacterized protein n=1 Tax=Suillus clintonianus TaxID=1904413 RepID=UPI001B868D60|nr:uncharacterized protein DEU56DRAFT_813962 [Suillus clintonianus]KAG2131320.1 hypothetical protein DEU56DRAFT_813962 [Suillus clintonianus]
MPLNTALAWAQGLPTNTYTCCHAHGDSRTFMDMDACSDADARTHTHADACTDTDACIGADARTHAHADAHTHAHVDAILLPLLTPTVSLSSLTSMRRFAAPTTWESEVHFAASHSLLLVWESQLTSAYFCTGWGHYRGFRPKKLSAYNEANIFSSSPLHKSARKVSSLTRALAHL